MRGSVSHASDTHAYPYLLLGLSVLTVGSSNRVEAYILRMRCLWANQKCSFMLKLVGLLGCFAFSFGPSLLRHPSMLIYRLIAYINPFGKF